LYDRRNYANSRNALERHRLDAARTAPGLAAAPQRESYHARNLSLSANGWRNPQW
jgi:hypothetical protein